MELRVHAAAGIFPMQSDSELAELAKSIEAYGLRERIQIITGEGGIVTIIDGRNRYNALKKMGKIDEDIVQNYCEELDLSQYNDASPEEYVLMANIERRNLTQKQRRELAGKLAVTLAERNKLLPKGQRVDATKKAAAAAGVSQRTAATAKQEVLDMAASHSENEATKPARAKTTKKGPKYNPAKQEVLLSDMVVDLNSFGHNFKIGELKTIIAKAKVMIEVAESKFEVVAKRAAEEAAVAAAEAEEALAEAKADRS